MKACNIVMAYRSLNGYLYESSEECEKQDKLFKDKQRQEQIYRKIKEILQIGRRDYYYLQDIGACEHVAVFLSKNPNYIDQIHDIAFYPEY